MGDISEIEAAVERLLNLKLEGQLGKRLNKLELGQQDLRQRLQSSQMQFQVMVQQIKEVDQRVQSQPMSFSAQFSIATNKLQAQILKLKRRDLTVSKSIEEINKSIKSIKPISSQVPGLKSFQEEYQNRVQMLDSYINAFAEHVNELLMRHGKFSQRFNTIEGQLMLINSQLGIRGMSEELGISQSYHSFKEQWQLFEDLGTKPQYPAPSQGGSDAYQQKFEYLSSQFRAHLDKKAAQQQQDQDSGSKVGIKYEQKGSQVQSTLVAKSKPPPVLKDCKNIGKQQNGSDSEEEFTADSSLKMRDKKNN